MEEHRTETTLVKMVCIFFQIPLSLAHLVYVNLVIDWGEGLGGVRDPYFWGKLSGCLMIIRQFDSFEDRFQFVFETEH